MEHLTALPSFMGQPGSYLKGMARYYGYIEGEPEYDADADVNEDGIVDALDGAIIGYHLGEKREHHNI